jgi:hypothetical protein
MESFGERWRAWIQEVLGRNMVEGWSIIGRIGTEKGADRGMAWDDYIFRHHGVPLTVEIREGNGPKRLFSIWSPFIGKNKAPLEGMIHVPLVKGTLVVDCDFTVAFEDVRHAVEAKGSAEAEDETWSEG